MEVDTMKYNHFLNCASLEDVKAKYKTLAKKLHPDAGGSHKEFVEMKEEYDNILVYVSYPIVNTNNGISIEDFNAVMNSTFGNPFTHPRGYQGGTTHLSPDEIQKQKAEVFFKAQRIEDSTYDLIDSILSRKSTDMWAFQEMSKIDDLELNHFKYLTFRLGKKIHVANNFYVQYLENRKY